MLELSDLAGLRIAHRGMRVEYGRLARAARGPRDAGHAALVADQIALTLDVLHLHHTDEDELLWPKLRARAPEAAADLDLLEAQHERIDPLLRAAGDPAKPLPDRADILDDLHGAVNEHLDDEERIAIPLLLRHLTPAENEEAGQHALAAISRRRLPLMFGWYASAADEKLRQDALATVPAVPRVLFRLFWWPSYQRRFARLYGDVEDLPRAEDVRPGHVDLPTSQDP